MIDLSAADKRASCCENAFLNLSAGCHTNHTLEQLFELVSSYRDRVERAAQIAGGFCLNAFDVFTRSDMPASVVQLPNHEEIVAGRRELLDAGIKMHGRCIVAAIYHSTERALQARIAEQRGEQYDPTEYMCANRQPYVFKPAGARLLSSVMTHEPEVDDAAVDASSTGDEAVAAGPAEDQRQPDAEGDQQGDLGGDRHAEDAAGADSNGDDPTDDQAVDED